MRERAGPQSGAMWLQQADARRGGGRPLGEVAQAMLRAAEQQPGTVRELAARAQVGYGAARYTSTRLVDRGQLQRIRPGRPAVLGAAGAIGGAALDAAVRSFWDVQDDLGNAHGTLVPATAEAVQAFACL